MHHAHWASMAPRSLRGRCIGKNRKSLSLAFCQKLVVLCHEKFIARKIGCSITKLCCDNGTMRGPLKEMKKLKKNHYILQLSAKLFLQTQKLCRTWFLRRRIDRRESPHLRNFIMILRRPVRQLRPRPGRLEYPVLCPPLPDKPAPARQWVRPRSFTVLLKMP